MMKTYIFTVVALLFFITEKIGAQGFQTDSPVEYNNYIVAEQSRLIDKVVDYFLQTVHNDNYKDVESKRLEVIGQIESSITKIERMQPFRGDSQMKEEALGVFKLYREAYVNDFSEVNLLRADRHKSYQAMEKHLGAQDLAEEKLRKAAEDFAKAQRTFAEAYQIDIVAAAGNDVLKIIAAVNKYERSVFLEFFKVSKLNGSCLDALNAQDAEMLEERRTLMENGAQESFATLRAMKPYNDDADYQNKTLAYISYHKAFAQKELAELVGILANPNRSNADVDRYNAIIKNYNRDISELINGFNDAKQRMLRAHIPKQRTEDVEAGKG